MQTCFENIYKGAWSEWLVGEGGGWSVGWCMWEGIGGRVVSMYVCIGREMEYTCILNFGFEFGCDIAFDLCNLML